MIQLRQAIQAGLKHPLLGPFVLLVFAVLLVFVGLHVVEHGIQGELFACVFAAAALVGLLTSPRRGLPRVSVAVTTADRAPPRRFFGSVVAYAPAAALLSTPLRR